MYELVMIGVGMALGHFIWAPDYSFKVFGGTERIKEVVRRLRG